MDVALSLATSLGLRVYLIRVASPTSFVASAIVGIWEGILVHQLSFHPPSSVTSSIIDHCLALGLRLVVDFLIAGSWVRVALVGAWAVVGAAASESAFPGIITLTGVPLMSSSNSQRAREKQYRRSQSAPSRIASHVRVYQAPVTPPALPIPPPRTSTPTNPTIKINTHALNGHDIPSPHFPPPSPPSFFLHASSELSPFPDSAVSPTPILSQIPARPQSSLSFYPEGAKGTEPEGNGAPSSPHLPTPPDSTIRERTLDSRVDRLSTIDEITSRSEHIGNDDVERDVESEGLYAHDSPPLPVPNAKSQYVRMDDDDLDLNTRDVTPLPLRPADWQPDTPSDGGDELKTPAGRVYDVSPESDDDPLKTPPALRHSNIGQNGYATISGPGPSGAPNGVLKVEKALSPLLFDTSIVYDTIPIPSTALSSYAILQPPVPPTPLGTLLAPVPPLPSTSSAKLDQKSEMEPQIDLTLSPSALSDAESVLSTRIPLKLLEHADDLRKQAIEENKELDRLRDELKKAQFERRGRDALFLRGDIQDAEERMRKLHDRAARRFYAGRNNLQKPNTIDVHGLKPNEALQKTEEALRGALKNGQGTLNVIVGKGLHSKGGVPVVKNHLIMEMQRRYIPCRVDPRNTGILILNLPPPINKT